MAEYYYSKIAELKPVTLLQQDFATVVFCKTAFFRTPIDDWKD